MNPTRGYSSPGYHSEGNTADIKAAERLLATLD
jgi:hypothetical protein